MTKPCPFCGEQEPAAVEGDGKWYVCCSNARCFCSLGEGYDGSAMPDHSFNSREAALAAWDTRLPPLNNGETEKVKEIAWVLCNVAECNGTKKNPCRQHYEAAKRLWLDVKPRPPVTGG